MKFRAAEKDESTITNSEEYKRLNLHTAVEETLNKAISVNILSPPKTISPRRMKSVPESTPSIVTSRRIPAEESLVLRLKTAISSPKPAPPLSKKKSSPTNVSVDLSQIDAALETRISLETIAQFLDRIPESRRVIPLFASEVSSSVSTILRSMSFRDIAQHLRSLRTDYIVRLARPVVTKLMQHPKNMKVFNSPVDLSVLPSYGQIVKSPIDLGTILSRLQMGSNYYDSLDTCFRDIQRVFDNAMLFNPAHHVVHSLAAEMKKELLAEMTSCLERCLKEIDRKKQHSCSFCSGCECHLCGEKCLKFEPSVQVCHGSCGQRIKKNSLYYLSADCSYLWCYKCYNNLPSVIIDAPAQGESTRLLKKDLIRRKSDEEIAEGWVECDTCGYWIHQVCALYYDFDYPSGKTGSNNQFQCPLCVLQTHSEGTSVSDTVVTSCSNIVGDSESDISGGRLRGGRRRAAFSNRTLVNTVRKNLEIKLPESTSFCVEVSTAMESVDMDLGPEIVSDSSEDGDAVSNISEGSNIQVIESLQQSTSIAYNARRFLLQEVPQEHMEGIDARNEVPLSEADERAGYHRTLVIDVEGDSESVDEMQMESKLDRNENASNGDLSNTTADSLESTQDLGDNDAVRIWKASALPRTHMSDFLENAVREMLNSNGYASIANTITIRLCSNRDHKLEVPRAIIDNMMTSDGARVPDFLAYRQKCILLFQKIDGIDVCLFCLYVHEFDDSCPAPNTSTVYIAYLDSVNYFRPSEARTMVYQEVVIGYLQWAQARGFKQGHIWSCPPQRGDNFIFNSHPSYQKTPSRERLNSWYNSVLMRATNLGILSDIGTLSDKYFTKYTKRDDVPQRHAAKNSSFGTAKANSHQKSKSKLPDKRKPPTQSSNADLIQVPTPADVPELEKPQPPLCTSASTTHNSFVGPKLQSLDAPHGTCPLVDSPVSDDVCIAPICPPIFEGDLWVMEWIKVSKNASSRVKGVKAGTGKDKVFNTKRMKELLRSIMFKHIAQPFNQPVDPDALNLPTYRTVISNPMDLGTVKENLRFGLFANMAEFYRSIELTFLNAMKFNPKGHYIHSNAEILLAEAKKAIISIASEFVEGEIENDSLESILVQFPLAAAGDLSLMSPREHSNIFSCSESIRGRSSLSKSEDTKDLSLLSSPLPCSSEDAIEAAHVLGEGRNIRKRKAFREISDSSVQFSSVGSPGPLRAASHDDKQGECFDLQLAKSSEEGTPNLLTRSVSLDGLDGEKAPEFNSEDSWCRERQQQQRRVNQSQALMNEQDIEESRKFSARDFNLQHVPVRFTKPVSTPKTLSSMLQELCKSVQRLNEDLFIFQFAPISSSRMVVDMSVQESNVGNASDLSTFARGKLQKGRAQAYLKRVHQMASKLPPGSIRMQSQREFDENLLLCMKCDSPEPDSRIISPLVDSRHSFLEACQFRHYQFDSLRRAQYSSLMILYHLHRPFDMRTRPTCHYCKQPIRHLRWHCDQCPNFECCQGCYVLAAEPAEDGPAESCGGKRCKLSAAVPAVPATVLPQHEHPLTPFRVSFF